MELSIPFMEKIYDDLFSPAAKEFGEIIKIPVERLRSKLAHRWKEIPEGNRNVPRRSTFYDGMNGCILVDDEPDLKRM